MNLIDARHMSDEEIEQFEGDLKAFLIMARERYDRKELKSVVARHRETWYSISVIKNDKRYIEYIDQISDEEIAGGMHMDATLDYIEALGEVRGEAKGKKKGQKEGIDKVNRLGQLLSQDGRAEDFMKSIMDPAYQQQLFTEYGL